MLCCSLRAHNATVTTQILKFGGLLELGCVEVDFDATRSYNVHRLQGTLWIVCVKSRIV